VQLTLSVLESLTRLPVSEREAILASESEAAQMSLAAASLWPGSVDEPTA
jgi:hypothetical protein